MEQIKNNDQQSTALNEIDYIDIPAFFRSMLRYARKYVLLVLPLIACMTAGLAVLSKPYVKKTYVAGGTSMIGVRLSDSLSFDYTLSGLSWDRQSTVAHLNSVLNALTESGYLTQVVRNSMGLRRDEPLKGRIYISAPYSTNLIDISVVSDSPEDAQAIRDAVLLLAHASHLSHALPLRPEPTASACGVPKAGIIRKKRGTLGPKVARQHG